MAGFEFKLEEENPGDSDIGPQLVARFNAGMKAVMNAIGAHAAERSVANAPIRPAPLGGALHASIRHTVTSNEREFKTEIFADTSYALRMHEELTPAGPLQLGPGSRDFAAATNAPEGGPGGKFLMRPAFFHLARYRNAIAETVKQTLGSKGKKIKVVLQKPEQTRR